MIRSVCQLRKPIDGWACPLGCDALRAPPIRGEGWGMLEHWTPENGVMLWITVWTTLPMTMSIVCVFVVLKLGICLTSGVLGQGHLGVVRLQGGATQYN